MKATFDNSFAALPPRMFTALTPAAVASPALIIRNEALAEDIGLTLEDTDVAVFAGNVVPDGASPLAQLYAGHQFGNWNPQLGDGRAILLGEVVGQMDERWVYPWRDEYR